MLRVSYLILLLTTCSVSEDDADWIPRWRMEIDQGHCSARCYKKYGEEMNVTTSDNTVTAPIMDCGKDDTECNDCDTACSRVFNALSTCKLITCKEKGAECFQSCKYHETLSRKKFNLSEIEDIIVQNHYPKQVLYDPNSITDDSILLHWPYSKQWENIPIVFVLIQVPFVNHTVRDEEKEMENAIHVGHTSRYVFNASHLNPKYCYYFKVVAVSDTAILGSSSTSTDYLAPNPKIKFENLTSTSIDIWVDPPPCMKKDDITFQFLVGEKIRLNSYPNRHEVGIKVTKDEIIKRHFKDLLPNTEYSVNVKPVPKSNAMFPWFGAFTTLPDAPSTTVDVISIHNVNLRSFDIKFRVTEVLLLWKIEPRYYTILVINTSTMEVTKYRKDDDSDPNEDVSFSIPNLIPYTTYCVKVIVNNDYGPGPESKGAKCYATLPFVPLPPRSLNVTNVTNVTATIRIELPLVIHGDLAEYIVTVPYSDGVNDVKHFRYPSNTSSQYTTVTLTDLKPFTDYNIVVFTRNHANKTSDGAEVKVQTLQSTPTTYPNITSCIVTSWDDKVNITLFWSALTRDQLNGVLQHFIVNITHTEFNDELDNHKVLFNTQHLYTKNVLSIGVQFNSSDIALSYNDTEDVNVRIAAATSIGRGPWSESYACTIEAKRGTGGNSLEIIVPIFGVIFFFIVAILIFLKFFKIKTYKKTPYEEIKKLMRSDYFVSPCQNCSHNKDPKKWDVFICYVSEDNDYIEDLKAAFVREKIEVFFAKDELSWGCSLHRVIFDGLTNSKYGLVVLSKQFITKCSKWTSDELTSLHSKNRYNSSEDLILPVWKADVTERDIAEFDIPLVNIKALKETEMTVEQMAVELRKKLNECENCCSGCDNAIPDWSPSVEYSPMVDTSPVDSLHTTLL